MENHASKRRVSAGGQAGAVRSSPAKPRRDDDMDISDDEPPHDDAADDDDSGAAEAIEVFSTWDPDTEVMRYRAYVAGATAPLNYKGYVGGKMCITLTPKSLAYSARYLKLNRPLYWPAQPSVQTMTFSRVVSGTPSGTSSSTNVCRLSL
mmetsp:Transcript_33642/g.117900  ORF Transcript_33642/g.117900 Transcript_33642/m.117900 type:complete len:150 (+) Transcript_33642:235-684(+)